MSSIQHAATKTLRGKPFYRRRPFEPFISILLRPKGGRAWARGNRWGCHKSESNYTLGVVHGMTMCSTSRHQTQAGSKESGAFK